MKTVHTSLIAVGLLALFASVGTAQDGQSGIVAVLDVAKVFKEHAGFNSRMESIKKEIEAFEEDFRQRREQLQNEVRTLQGLVGKPEYKTEEAALARKEADLQIEANQKRAEILTREAKIYFDTYNEVVGVVGEMATSYGITLVIRYDSSEIDQTDRASVIKGVNRNVIFQRDLDLTPLVLQKVNGAVAPN